MNQRAKIEKALKVVHENLHNPLGFMYHNGRPLFVFEKVKESRAAYNDLEVEKDLVKCWWWSQKSAVKENLQYERISQTIRQDVESKRRQQEAVQAGAQSEEVSQENSRQRYSGGNSERHKNLYEEWKRRHR